MPTITLRFDQAKIDRVLGNNRVPQLTDYPKLNEAYQKETGGTGVSFDQWLNQPDEEPWSIDDLTFEQRLGYEACRAYYDSAGGGAEIAFDNFKARNYSSRRWTQSAVAVQKYLSSLPAPTHVATKEDVSALRDHLVKMLVNGNDVVAPLMYTGVLNGIVKLLHERWFPGQEAQKTIKTSWKSATGNHIRADWITS